MAYIYIGSQDMQHNQRQECINANAVGSKQIVITGTGLNLKLGAEREKLVHRFVKNTDAKFSGMVMATVSPLEFQHGHAVSAKVDDTLEDDIAARMLQCLYAAVVAAVKSAQFHTHPRKNVLFYLVFPMDHVMHVDDIPMDEWLNTLSRVIGCIGGVELRIKPCNGSITDHLMFAVQGLQERHWDTVIFATLDSFTGQLNNDDITTAKLPDEAAVVLVCERAADIPVDAQCCLQSLAIHASTSDMQGTLRQDDAIYQAIVTTLQQAQVELKTIDKLVLALDGETSTLQQWQQAELRLWSSIESAVYNSLPLGPGQMEEESGALQSPEKLNIDDALTEIGIAKLPMAIALAVLRFHLGHNPMNNVLVVEAAKQVNPSVVLLSPTGEIRESSQLGYVA